MSLLPVIVAPRRIPLPSTSRWKCISFPNGPYVHTSLVQGVLPGNWTSGVWFLAALVQEWKLLLWKCVHLYCNKYLLSSNKMKILRTRVGKTKEPTNYNNNSQALQHIIHCLPTDCWLHVHLSAHRHPGRGIILKINLETTF